MQRLIIMRGLPGSGKSTIAAGLGADVVVSADDFFTQSGTYLYQPSRIAEAHSWCRLGVRLALEVGLSVVVDNTHTRRWEYAPYLAMAQEFGITPEIIIAQGNWPNVHGVPQDVIERMRERWED